MKQITGSTTVVGIIGYPVSHSLSPIMHNAAFSALGLDWVYVPFPVVPGTLPEALAGFKALCVAGFNATIPHKVSLLPLLDQVTPEAELIGAVNTVTIREGRAYGSNTDGIGLLTALDVELGFHPAGRSVLLLGSGGAARSAVAALASSGAAGITLVNRTPEAAMQLVGTFGPHYPEVELSQEPLALLSQGGFLREFDLIVNTTSVGMRGDSFGMDLSLLKKGAVVYDMVYAPAVTPLLAEARRCGVPCANGLSMLVAQGEASFETWTGVRPPSGCMRKALADRVGQVSLDNSGNTK